MTYVGWMLESTINDRDALNSVMADANGSVSANEPRTTHYEWSVSADGSQLVNYERFEDSVAAMEHLAGFGAFAERFMSAVTVNRFLLFGEPSDEVKAAVATFNAQQMTPIGGFARLERM